MRSLVRVALVSALLASLYQAAVQAQSVLDRPVGRDFFDKPLVISTLTAQSIGALGGAAQVPMGFEAAVPGGPSNWRIEATGRTLRSVLDAIVAADSRYAYQEQDGVVVITPTAAAAWVDRENSLHRTVNAIHYDNIGIGEAMRIAAALFGANLHPSQADNLGDQKRFALNLPAGTVLEVLNGIVRAHGSLTWSLEPWPPPAAASPGTKRQPPFQLLLVRGAGGRAHGVGVSLKPPIALPEDLEPAPLPQPGTSAILDRIVGPKANSLPLKLRGVVEVPELAAVAHVPMGVELVPPTQPRVLTPGDGTIVTGMALRDALATLIALDPRYEWREIDGVIVIRPIAAWTDMAHPLLREVGPIHFTDVTLQNAVDYQQTLLEPGKRHVPMAPAADATRRTLSVDLPAGTLLTLVNATARAHGAACWIYEELDEKDTAFYGGRSHQLSMQGPDGTGMGFAFR